MVSDSVLGPSVAPSPSLSTGTKNSAASPATSEAGFPSSFSPSIHEVFHPPSMYFRKSSAPASMTSRPSR